MTTNRKLFHFDTVKKSLVVFAKLFNDITIQREAQDGSATKEIDVELLLANKEKFYKRLNTATTADSVRVTLPAIALWFDDVIMEPSRQHNANGVISTFSKEDESVAKILPMPIPITIPITMRVRTRYMDDMLQCIDAILPRSNKQITRTVNLIPNMGISFDVQIFYVGQSSTFADDRDEDAESIINNEMDYEFEIQSYVFPPIEYRNLAGAIKVYDADGVRTYEMSKSVADVGAKDEDEWSSITPTFFRALTVSDIPYTDTIMYDASDVIAVVGDNLKITDENGEGLAFVFEYSNGEFFGSDYLIPAHISGITKTGNIAIKAIDVPDDRSYNLVCRSTPHDNYEFGYNVMPNYFDFEAKSFEGMIFNNVHTSTVRKIEGGIFYFCSPHATFDTMTRMYAKIEHTGFSLAEVKIADYTFEAGKTLMGMYNRAEEKYILLKTGADETVANLYSRDSDGNETLLLPITLTESISLVEIIHGVDDSMKVNSSEVPILSGYDLVFLGNDFSDPVQYDFLKII